MYGLTNNLNFYLAHEGLSKSIQPNPFCPNPLTAPVRGCLLPVFHHFLLTFER
jgi:hypothetical protein